MNPEPELFPTVFRETLWGKQYFDRIEQLQASGAKIETQEVGKGNGEWIITWREARNSEVHPAVQSPPHE